MRQKSETGRRRDLIFLLLALITFLLASPFLDWWADPKRPWFLIYCFWGVIIVLIYLIARQHRQHDL